jgi:hypothetical protein
VGDGLVLGNGVAFTNLVLRLAIHRGPGSRVGGSVRVIFPKAVWGQLPHANSCPRTTTIWSSVSRKRWSG